LRKKFVLSLVILILLTGCASPSGRTLTAPTTTSSTTATIIPATHTPLPPTLTPFPTPTVTAMPIPKDFNAQNFSQFTGVESYGSTLAKYFNKETFDVLTYAMDYSADGSTIAIGGCVVQCSNEMGGRYFLLLLDPSLVNPIQEIPLDNTSQIWDVDLNPDGSVLIYSMRDLVLRYDRTTGQTTEVYKPKGLRLMPSDAISPDGKTLVIVTDNELLALNMEDNSQIARISGTFYGFSSPFFNSQGNRFIVYSKQTDRDVIVYDTATWTELGRFPIVGTGKAAISADGKLLATLSQNDTAVKLYDLAAGTEKDLPIAPYVEVASLIFNPANDLLLTFGDPGPNVDLDEGVQVIGLQSAKVVGSLTQENNPGKIKFSADGTTFLRFGNDSTFLEQWSLPNADILKIETLIRDYFAAISKGDYQAAVTMTQLDSYSRDEMTKDGFNPDDLPAAFASLCAPDVVSCLPLGRIIRVMADFGRGWDYYAIVTLKQADGSEIMFDGITPYEMLGIIRLADGSFKVSTLHPGMRYPYKN
jgi:WD40 repeat protein